MIKMICEKSKEQNQRFIDFKNRLAKIVQISRMKVICQFHPKRFVICQYKLHSIPNGKVYTSLEEELSTEFKL